MKLISSDKIDIREAIKTLNEEDRVGGFMKMLERERIEAKDERNLEIAKTMLIEGVEIVFISKITKLSVEEIKKLIKE